MTTTVPQEVNMIFRKTFALIAFALVASFVHAQVACDPLDWFYDDLEVWEAAGLVNNLPAARPYPLQLVSSILESVLAQGDATQRKIAKSHYDRFFGRSFTWGYKAEAATDTAEMGKEIDIAISMDLNLKLLDIVTASASLEGWAVNRLPASELRPAGDGSPRDIIEDNAKVGPFWLLPAMNSSLAVGTDTYYLNAGLMRGSFGPFRDGVVVGEQALHDGQFSFAANEKLWGFNLSLYSITASDGNGEHAYPAKYVTVHNFEWRPFSWFNISLLESIVYGGRFEPMYVQPLSPFMISQGVTGFNDNSWLGGMFTLKPVPGLRIDGVLYADDLSFNDIARLNFDTKWRLAGQIGTTWASPSSGIFTLASIDYTMVTPYTYSHKNGDPLDLDAVNYQNYTHYGENFGAALNPNSDKLNLRLKLRPLEGVDFDIVGVMIRHGNVNEGIDSDWVNEYITNGENAYRTDGTILNASGSAVGHAYNYTTPLLTQDHVQYIWQTGFDALCRLPILKTGGYLVFRLGYRLEYLTYPGIDSRIYRYDADLGLDPDDAALAASAREQLNDWIDGLGNPIMNNYIRAGFEYHY